MEIIITENQDNQLGLEKKADVLYKLIQMFYPENYESYSETNNQTEVFDSEDNETLLFYYDWDTKELYIGLEFLQNLYQPTLLPFLDVLKIRAKEKQMFNILIKVFAKRHYGWNVDSVFFHYY